MTVAEMLQKRRADRSQDERAAGYAELVDELRDVLDSFARSDPSAIEIAQLRWHLASVRELVERTPVPEEERLWAHSQSGRRVQCMIPDIVQEELRDGVFRGRVVIGDFFLGLNAAAHGGVVSLVFDEMLGRVAGSGRPVSRTAYLTTTFRSITPIGEELELHARLDRIDGRKRFVSGEIRHGETVCAQGEALFVELRPEHR